MVPYLSPHYSLGCGICTHEVNFEFIGIPTKNLPISGSGHAPWKVATYAGFGDPLIYTNASMRLGFLSRSSSVIMTFSQVYSVKAYFEKSGFLPAAGTRNFCVLVPLVLIV